MSEARRLLSAIRAMHERIRAHVVAACERAPPSALATVASDGEGDTLYAVDRIGEELLVECAADLARVASIVLLAEGMSPLVLPAGTRAADARFRVLVDPIDGTRGLMYQKRSAWILTAVAANAGDATRLAQVELAVQTEIPLVKQHLADGLWAVRGEGAHAERVNRLTGEVRPLHLAPSRATTIAHGFAQVARFFPGARDVLAAIDEEIARAALGPSPAGKARAFEDQYASSAGQLYELMAGHDRFVADLRPLMRPVLAARGDPLGICSHPYDLCTALIAEELGVEITDPRGQALDCPLDLASDVAWVGYANAAIRAQVEPLLQAALRRRGLLEEP